MATSRRLHDLDERLAGLDSSNVVGLGRVYFVASVSLLIVALLVVISTDVLRGDTASALRVGGLILVLTALLFRAPTQSTTSRRVYRAIVASGLAVVTYEASLGANDGFTFLWYFVFPVTLYFLLGRRESIVWNTVIGLIFAWLLLTGDASIFPGGHPGFIPLLSFLLLCLLAHGVEATRGRLLTALRAQNRAQEDVSADLESLKGLLPLCARCKKTRSDDGFWSQIDAYLARHSLAELQAARCLGCRDQLPDDLKLGAVSTNSTTINHLRALELEQHRAKHVRQRRFYFSLGLLSVIPALIYFGVTDTQAGNIFEAALAFALATLFAGGLFLLWIDRFERRSYAVGLGAVVIILAYDLYAGSFGGFAPVWLYSLPIFVLLLFGLQGVGWSVVIFCLAGFFLLFPVGHDYPIEFAGRFLITFFLSSVTAFWLESMRTRTQSNLEREHAALTQALDEVHTLRGMLPRCPQCKAVRDDEGFKERVEAYLSGVSGTRFSHGQCPECAAEMLAELSADEAEAV